MNLIFSLALASGDAISQTREVDFTKCQLHAVRPVWAGVRAEKANDLIQPD